MTSLDPVELAGPFVYPVVLFAVGLLVYGVLYLFERVREQ